MKKLLLILTLPLLFLHPANAQNTLDSAGLTAATPASIAFSLRKMSSSYAGSIIKVRRASDNAEALVDFDANNGVGATSVVTLTPGVVISASTGTAQTGTISTETVKTGTISISANKTGTINTGSNSITVTGSGTSFTSEIVAGDRLFNAANNVFMGVVASVTNNTTLLLTNYATATISVPMNFKTSAATVVGVGTSFLTELSVGDRLFNNARTYLGTIASINSATSLTLNAADAVSASAISFKGSSAVVTGSGTSFTGLAVGTLLISNNTTLGIISSIASATSLTLAAKAGACLSASAYKSTAGSMPFSTFYSGTSVYVAAWYDQSGYARDAFQPKPGNQARIVNAGTLYTVNGRTSMQFSGTLSSFLQTATAASYLNNSLYTLNKVTAEATINPVLQLPISSTGGNGPGNSISHYGYRSSSQFTVAQYGNDQNFYATPSTSLELHTSVKISTASSQFYKNGISLGILSSGVPSHLVNVGLLNIGHYTPTNSYYDGSISELTVFPTALGSTAIAALDNNQLAYYNVATTFWTGAVSTDWNNTGNWSTGVLPTLSSPAIVVVPAGMPRYPVISATASANSISLEAGTSLTITDTLKVAGTIINLGTCTATSGTISYSGTASQSIAANTFAGNAVQGIAVSNSTGVVMNGNLTITGNLAFITGRLAINGNTLTIGGDVINTFSGGLTGSATSSLVASSTVSPSISFDQTVANTTNSLRNLTINSASQVATLLNNLTMNASGSTTFTAGKLAIGTATLTLRGAVVNSVAGGLRGGLLSNITVDGSASATLSFDQTTPGNTNALSNLTLNCAAQTVTLANNLTIATALNLTSGTLADGGNQLTSAGTVNLIAGKFRLGSPTAATVWPSFATNNISSGSTIEYAAGVSQVLSTIPSYENLTISATGGTIASNDISVAGVLNLAAPNPSAVLGSLSMGTYTLSMGAYATTIGQGDVTGIVKRTSILPSVNYTMGNEFTSITFPNTGTLPSEISMKIAIGTAPSWSTGAIKRQYDFIQTGGSGTKAVINSHYLDAELNGNTESKLVDFSYRFTGTVLTEHGKSNFNTTQNWVGLSNVNVAFFSSTFGNVALSLDESSLTTLTWNGSTSTSWITATNWTPNGGPSTNTNLIIPDAATTSNDPYLPATASNGSLTIESGGIVYSDPSAQLTLNNTGLAWSNVGGTFNAGSSTIFFADANASMNGVTSFNNVTINTGAGLLITTGTTMRIGGTLVNNGTFRPDLLHNTVEYNGNNQTIVLPNSSSAAYRNLVISGTGTSTLPAAVLVIIDSLTINGAISTTGNTISMSSDAPQIIRGTSPLTLNNLTINKTLYPVSLLQNLTVANALTFTSGKLSVGANTLTLSGTIVNTVANGIIGSAVSNLIINGAASPVLSFDQSLPGTSNKLNNLSINAAGQAPLLGCDLELGGLLTFTAGKLGINGNTLALQGDVLNTVAGGLRGSATSNLLLGSATASPFLSFDQTSSGISNALNNFTIASAGQTASLANALVMNGILTLTNGFLATTSAASLTLKAGATTAGGSDSSYVSGPISLLTNSTSVYNLPLGKDNSYRPLALKPATTSAGSYKAEYFPLTTPAGTLSSTITGLATDEYWDVARLSGPDASLTLLYDGTNFWSTGSPTASDFIYVSALTGGTWSIPAGSKLPGNIGGGMNAVTASVLSTASSFTFGYGSSAPLPLTLLDFTALVSGPSVSLLWHTANEVSIALFGLERSADGSRFSAIASVLPSNTMQGSKYIWIDAPRFAGELLLWLLVDP